MSLIAWMGAIETGFVYALVALGVFLSFRILDFPDLTVDGSFPLGAAVAATAIVGGWDPFLSTALAFVAGCIAGSITAWLNVRLKILNLLASILMMIALYSINLRIMGRPNVALLGERTVLTPFEGLGLPFYLLTPLVFAVVVIAAMILLIRFLNSEMGLAMRATGANARMARAQGINTAAMTLLGMALSNGLVAIGGALFAQSQGSADVTMGVGTIVVGLASVIGGEAVMSTRTIARAIIACLVGAILYRVAVALALNAGFLGLTASDLNLVTAVLVAAAMVLPRVLAQRRRKAA
ncbi:ABC transporter permease [Tistrella mobilis]|uniref:ABC-type transport system, permease component n=1 Tax=Tistrella mobilis (strain KA081020-065) TaxID=1110502 RepID=I3TGW2_TISMK|nr:ABC transporter permease [Tistrella mobilis]AFK52000.1 ABC-type transport system, permease component [Tistrella mobilis KA081020-065]MAM73449.1 ABC transporter permease [Tistrella sp.]